MAADKAEPKAKAADKPPTVPPDGPVVSLLGMASYYWVTFKDGFSFEFEVDALLTAQVEMDERDGDGEDLGIGLWNSCAVIRQALRRDHPDHPFGKLPLPEFMSKVAVPLRSKMLPDFDAIDPNHAGVLQEGHPFV